MRVGKCYQGQFGQDAQHRMDLFEHRQGNNLRLNQDDDFDSDHLPEEQRQDIYKEGAYVNAQSHVVINLSLAVNILCVVSQ